jgi:hypothetical protein
MTNPGRITGAFWLQICNLYLNVMSEIVRMGERIFSLGGKDEKNPTASR